MDLNKIDFSKLKIVAYGRWAEGLPVGTRLMHHDNQLLVNKEYSDFYNIPLYALIEEIK
jgi:hypothetical protein